MSDVVDLYKEKLTLPELQRVVARLVEYLDVDVTRRKFDGCRPELSVVPRIIEDDT